MDYTCIHFIEYLAICTNGTSHDCHGNATCIDSEGSYTCMCKDGYTGNGTFCAGEVKI